MLTARGPTPTKSLLPAPASVPSVPALVIVAGNAPLLKLISPFACHPGQVPGFALGLQPSGYRALVAEALHSLKATSSTKTYADTPEHEPKFEGRCWPDRH